MDTSIIKWRIWPRDLDINFHLNNGAAITIMDFGRYDLVLRMGMLKMIMKEKLRPIVGSSMVKFRYPLPAFALCELHTSIIGWDEKWIYFDQKFIYKNKISGQAYLKTLLHGPSGSIPPAELADKMGITESPPLPDIIKQWKEINF